jgi:hypothetical protein
MSKTLDMFTEFYSILDYVITNSKYNANIKVGLLKLIPTKLKKFNTLMKGYSPK